MTYLVEERVLSSAHARGPKDCGHEARRRKESSDVSKRSWNTTLLSRLRRSKVTVWPSWDSAREGGWKLQEARSLSQTMEADQSVLVKALQEVHPWQPLLVTTEHQGSTTTARTCLQAKNRSQFFQQAGNLWLQTLPPGRQKVPSCQEAPQWEPWPSHPVIFQFQTQFHPCSLKTPWDPQPVCRGSLRRNRRIHADFCAPAPSPTFRSLQPRACSHFAVRARVQEGANVVQKQKWTFPTRG